MKQELKTITIGGIEKPIVDWAKDAKVSVSAIHTRLNRGWDAERAVFAAAKAKPAVTKDNAERLLNDMTRDQLPSRLAKVLPKDCAVLQLGAYIRRHHRQQFDDWFAQVYVPNHSHAIE